MDFKVPFFWHDLGKPELDILSEVFTGDILTTGDYAERFEKKFAAYLGRNHALGVTSCTGALHMSLLGLDIGPGDEVITTPMTFIATASAIIEAGAKPVFVDVEPETGNMDVLAIEAAISKKTKAIIPVHLYGLMCDMRALREIADRHGLKIVEDAAHCIEGTRDGVRPGELSDAACFSFYATKNMTCGEGGAVVTDDTALYERMKLLRLHGMTKTAADRAREGYSHWDMVVLGWKYNMSNIEAALLLPQFDRLQTNLDRRHRLAELYRDRLQGISSIHLPFCPNDAVHARHLFPIWINGHDRDEMVEYLKQNGIGVVVNYRAVHLMHYFAKTYGYQPGAFPIAEKIGEQTLSLPFYPSMPEEHVDIVTTALRSRLGNE